MSTKLKAVEKDAVEKAGDSPEETQGAMGLTEELPPMHIHPTSFDARIAGIEPCSVIRGLSKHHSGVAAYELRRAQARGEAKTSEEGERRQREAWERQWEKKPEDLDEYIELIKGKACASSTGATSGRCGTPRRATPSSCGGPSG